jgi:hypothetical protein
MPSIFRKTIKYRHTNLYDDVIAESLQQAHRDEPKGKATEWRFLEPEK